MTESKNNQKPNDNLRSIIIGLCLVSFPFLNYIAHNFNDQAFVLERFLGDIFPVFCLISILCIVIPSVIALILKRPSGQFILPLSLLWIALSLFSSTHAFLKTILGNFEDVYLLGSISIYAIALILIFLLIKKDTVRSLVTVFAVFMSGVTIVRVALLVIGDAPYQSKSSKTQNVGQEINEVVALKNSPNIYYIVVDAYTSPQAMEYYFDLDLTAFINRMSKLGLESIRDARSPYNTTFLTLAAIFKMDYPIVEVDTRAKEGRDGLYPSVMRNKSAAPVLVEKFKELGYDFNHIGNK